MYTSSDYAIHCSAVFLLIIHAVGWEQLLQTLHFVRKVVLYVCEENNHVFV